MALYETEALVLKSYNLAEADRIVVFLTKEHGVVRGVAKGAKRLKSKFGGSLEPFTVVRLSFFQKEALELVSIRNIELEKSYFAEASEPAFLQKFSYLADVLLALTPPHDPSETLYRMVRAALATASDDAESLKSIGVYFEVWLLRLGGYLPDWSSCDECKREFDETEPANLQMNFHLLCGNCRRTRSEIAVTPRHREIYRSALRLAPQAFFRSARSWTTELDDVSSILKRIISQAIGREVTGEKSLAMSP